MAPNPIITTRNWPAQQEQTKTPRKSSDNFILYFYSAVGLACLVAIPTTRSWARAWMLSGAGVEHLLLVQGSLNDNRERPNVRLHTLLLLLNMSYLLSSTSWLFRLAFPAACYCLILWTCLVQYQSIATLARRGLRRLFPKMHFFEDKVGVFDVPALAIDVDVTGLFVVRGLTLSFSNLMLEVHGVELAIRLNAQTELCLYLDHMVVQFFEGIELSDIYGNLKIGEHEGLFAHAGTVEADKDQSSQTDKRLLKGTDSFLLSTGVDVNRNNQQAINEEGKSARTTTSKYRQSSQVPQDDIVAKENYDGSLQHIEETSPISIARRHLEVDKFPLQSKNENELRQMICSKLRDFPSLSHIPEKSVRVSVLQTIFPRIRRFLHRLPLLLRLVLSPLSYFHPIYMSSINIAGPGEELERLVNEYLPQKEASSENKNENARHDISAWLNGADFCLEITDITSLAQVPFGPTGLITIYLRGANVGVYRTSMQAKEARLVTHIGGADATFVIPAFLLPHHEHYLPPKPGDSIKKRNLASGASTSEASTFKLHGQAEYEDTAEDITEVIISMHASLPTYFDQSLLDIAAALAKATELVDLENLFDRESSDGEPSEEQSRQGSSANMNDNASSDETARDQDSEKAGTASRARQYLKHGIKKSLKMNAVGDKLNDRWIARTVGKVAAKLEDAQGDFGYTVRRPVPLQPYRLAAESDSKILR